jgi:hypothetical protein
MVRYFYAWTPLVLAGAVVLLTLPWLGLIALFVLALAALAALAALMWAIVTVPIVLGRAVTAAWQGRSVPAPQTAPALAPAPGRHVVARDA